MRTVVPELFNDFSDPDKFKRNLVKVDVYYEDLNFRTVTESPAYTVSGKHDGIMCIVIDVVVSLSLGHQNLRYIIWCDCPIYSSKKKKNAHSIIRYLIS